MTTTEIPLEGFLSADDHASAIADVAAGMGRGRFMTKYGVGSSRARRFIEWAKDGTKPATATPPSTSTPPPTKTPSGWTASLTMGSTGGTLVSGPVTKQITDWDELLKLWDLDPAVFEVVEPVTFKAWDMGFAAHDGVEWDEDPKTGRRIPVIHKAGASKRLYSYRADIKRKTADEQDQAIRDDIKDALAALRKWKPGAPIRRTLGVGLGKPVTYAHVQGDEQGGKHEGGGIPGLQQREADSVEASLAYVRSLLRQGVNIENLAVVKTGDRIENIFGHYNNQARTTATLREQFRYAYISDVEHTKAFAELGIPIDYIVTPSNHGDIRQAVGAAPFTSASDNYDLIIAEIVQSLLSESAIADQIRWHIPHDEYITPVTLSGVETGTTHGHKATGDIAKWVVGQANFFMRHKGYPMRVVFMGHRHHARIEDLGGIQMLMTPSLDGGSPYFEAAMGTRAGNGVLGCLIGDSFKLGWSHLSAL